MKSLKTVFLYVGGISACIVLGTQLANLNPFATKNFVVSGDTAVKEEVSGEVEKLNTTLTTQIIPEMRDDNAYEASAQIEKHWRNICRGTATARVYDLLEEQYKKFEDNKGRSHGFQQMQREVICPIVE